MATPAISQLLASSFESVLASKPANQWAESAFLQALEKLGAIKRISMGPTIQAPLDYQRTPNSGFLATDLQSTSLVKTEVIQAAEYTPGQLSVEMVWSKADEAKNSGETQKIALVKSIMENALETHDDLIEDALFDTSTDGFLGLQTQIADSGQGTCGGINAATEAWWRNGTGTYLAAGTNIEASLTAAFNAASKGSGSKMGVKLLVSGSAAQAIYEGQLQADHRYIETAMGDAGYKQLAFKTAGWVFSPHGGTRIYGINPKSFKLVVSKDAFKSKGDTIEIPNAHGYVCKMFSMLQTVVDNRSRLFVLTQN
jgi:hypothetical protein